MEWLEFNRWSPEVQQALTAQVARLAAAHPPPRPTPRIDTRTMAERLHALLRQHPPARQ